MSAELSGDSLLLRNEKKVGTLFGKIVCLKTINTFESMINVSCFFREQTKTNNKKQQHNSTNVFGIVLVLLVTNAANWAKFHHKWL